MNLTPRLEKIMTVMLKENRVLSVKELADKIGVSKRTVQRELEYLGTELQEYEIQFVSKTGKGVWLEGAQDNKVRLLADLERTDSFDVSDREERRKRLTLEILKEKGLKKLFYYADQFKVSEATISSDLDAISGWLLEHQLQITRKPGSGIEVEGTEESYRKAIRSFIAENINTQAIRDSYEVDDSLDGMKKLYGTGIGLLLKDDILKRVVNCISSLEDRRVLTLTENSYVGLVLHISIAINRIMQDEYLENSEKLEELPEDEDYELAGKIVEVLEEEFDIEIPDAETAYICLHIKGAKHQNIEWNGTGTVEIKRKELIGLVNDMINAFDSTAAFELKQDEDFIQGLLAHLQPTVIRLVNDMAIANPVLEDIKTAYPDTFEKSRKAALILGNWVGKEVPESEIGFLTIHFGAAQVRLEGRRENIRQVHVGIVCASGIGISRLMLSKLEKVFKERIKMETYGKNDITPYIAGKTDFFVTSIAMTNPDLDIIQVNPLLNGEDVEQIRKKVYEYERIPRKQQEESKFSVEMEEVTILAMQIKTILKEMRLTKVSETIGFEELLIAVSEEMSPYMDRQDLIREDMQQREKIGSQVFAEFGFALIHTRTQGVIKPSFTVYRTQNQKAFEDPYFKGIGVVLVMLLPVDENIKINSEILGFISSTLIEDYDFLMILSEGDEEKIREALSGVLRTFFHQYLER